MDSRFRESIAFLLIKASYQGTKFSFSQLFCNIVATLLQRREQVYGHTMEIENSLLINDEKAVMKSQHLFLMKMI